MINRCVGFFVQSCLCFSSKSLTLEAVDTVEAVEHCHVCICTSAHVHIEVGDEAVVVVLLFTYHRQVYLGVVITFT